MQETNLIFFNLENKIPLEKELLAHYSDDMNFKAHSLTEYEALLDSVKASGKSLVIGKIESRKDFICLVKLLKAARKKLKNNSLKVAVFNLIQNKKVEKILATYHCHDYLSLNMNIKTYFFKIDFWARALKSDFVEQPKKNKKLNTKNIILKAEEENKVIPLVFKPPLEKKEDIWVLKNRTDCKKVLKRWLVRIKGPSPQVCLWERVPSEGDSRVIKWKLIFKQGFDLHAYGMEKGYWFFIGTRPEFDWKRGTWIFSGEDICLYFKEDKEEFNRFFLSEGKLIVHENDEFAAEKEELLDKTKEIKIIEKNAQNDSQNAVFKVSDTAFGYYRGALNEKNKKTPSSKKSDFFEGDLGGHYSGSVKVVPTEVQDHNGIKKDQNEASDFGGVIHDLFREVPDYISEKEESSFEISEEEFLESGKFVVEIRQLLEEEEKVYVCQFEDLYETELVTLFKREFSLELAPVKVNMFFSYRNESVEIKNIQGQIVEIEEYNEENHLAVIDLMSVPELELKRLMKLYYQRQNAINVFMHKAKGF